MLAWRGEEVIMLILVTREALGGTITEAIQSSSIHRIKPYKDPSGFSKNRSTIITIKGEDLFSNETVEELTARIKAEESGLIYIGGSNGNS